MKNGGISADSGNFPETFSSFIFLWKVVHKMISMPKKLIKLMHRIGGFRQTTRWGTFSIISKYHLPLCVPECASAKNACNRLALVRRVLWECNFRVNWTLEAERRKGNPQFYSKTLSRDLVSPLYKVLAPPLLDRFFFILAQDAQFNSRKSQKVSERSAERFGRGN